METNNKLIAKFMGYERRFDIIDDNKYQGEITLTIGLSKDQIEGEISHFEDRYSITPISQEEELKYHTSWNWLMPVLKELWSLKSEYDFESDFSEKFEEVFDIDFTFCDLMSGDIESVCGRVAEFLEWYNKNK